MSNAQMSLFEMNTKKPVDAMKEIAIVKPEFVYRSGMTDVNRNPSLQTKNKTISLFKDMLSNDDRLYSDFWKFKNILLSTPWHITIDDTSNKAMKRAQWIEDMLNNTDIPIEDSLFQLLDAIVIGFSLLEKVYYNTDDVKIAVKYLKPKNQRYIDFETDIFGNLQHVIVARFTSQEKRVPPNKFIIGSFPNPYGDNLYHGMSVLTPIYEWYQLKYYIRKWFAKTLELEMSPPIIGKVRKDLDKVTKTELKSIVDSLKSFHTAKFGVEYVPSSSGTLQEIPDLKLERFETKTTKEIWVFINELIKDIDSRISYLFLTPPDLSGDAKTGSYARAKEQLSYNAIVLAAVQRWLEQLMNKQLIPQIEDLNYPPNEIKKYGRCKFVFEEDESFTKERAEALKILAEAGLLNDIDKNWIFNDYLFVKRATEQETEEKKQEELTPDEVIEVEEEEVVDGINE